MRWILWVGLAALCVPAQATTVADQTQQVLEKNFAATSAGDVRALEKTCARSMPGRQQFLTAAEELFAETQVYLRLERFELLAAGPDWAVAHVVQTTLAPREAREEPPASVRQARHNMCLLPQPQTVEYRQLFRRERGKWLVSSIDGRPVEPPADWADRPAVNRQQPGAKKSRTLGGCANGNCQFPRVR